MFRNFKVGKVRLGAYAVFRVHFRLRGPLTVSWVKTLQPETQD